jgi:hypothetical protein
MEVLVLAGQNPAVATTKPDPTCRRPAICRFNAIYDRCKSIKGIEVSLNSLFGK